MSEQAIFVRKVGVNEAWSTPETSTYDSESDLQALLADNPSRIPGVEVDAIAVRELQTSAGPIDICVVSPHGEITVVECKLQRNSEPRRMVLGQVIDYASALHHDGPDAFYRAWKARGGQSLDEFLEPDGLDSLETSLRSGQLHLAVAVDRIDDDLRRLIEFLNVVSREDIRVTALQLSYSRHGDVEVLIPSAFGAEIALAKSNRGQSHVHWTWDEFLESLPSPPDQEFARAIYDRVMSTPSTGPHNKIWCGRRPKGGVLFYIHGERFSAFQLTRGKSGDLRVFGNWNLFPSLQGDGRFAELATVLRQSHVGPSKEVPADSVDLDDFWLACLTCDREINSK